MVQASIGSTATSTEALRKRGSDVPTRQVSRIPEDIIRQKTGFHIDRELNIAEGRRAGPKSVWHYIILGE
jgi:hypothetical protein